MKFFDVTTKGARIRWSSTLANTTEPSTCGGDAACCQITFTTCCLLLLNWKSW